MSISSCQMCRRPLRDPKSQAVGFGPNCAAKARGRIREYAGDHPLDSFLFDEAGNPDVVLRRRDGGEGRAGVAMSNVPQVMARHSPAGFEWGYAGSGPADLALNILLRHGLIEREALELHQWFKQEFIEPMPAEGGVIRRQDIKAWVAMMSESRKPCPPLPPESEVRHAG